MKGPTRRASMHFPCASAYLLAALVLTAAGVCRAQDEAPSDQAAAARTLFDEARGLMDAKDFEHACPKFEESYRLSPGGGTLLNLAMCNERRGRTATAWANFQEGLRLARRDGRADREKLAQEHIDALTPRLSKLTLTVPPAARVKGLVLRRNGVEVGEAAWDAAMPVDPGDQVIEVSAPGKTPARATVTVGDGERRGFTVPVLADAPASTTPERGPSPVVTSSRAAATARSSSGSGQELLGGILAGAGVVGVGLGTYFALHARSLDQASSKDCPSTARCSPAGLQESRDAVRNADLATGAFIAGGVLAAAGAALFFTAGPSKDVRAGAVLSPTEATLRVTGAF